MKTCDTTKNIAASDGRENLNLAELRLLALNARVRKPLASPPQSGFESQVPQPWIAASPKHKEGKFWENEFCWCCNFYCTFYTALVAWSLLFLANQA